MRAGDLLGTGTISGSASGSQGCLLEITRDGLQALIMSFPGGSGRVISRRGYLEDGDKVIMTGYGELEDGFRVGFGSVEGVIVSAHLNI